LPLKLPLKVLGTMDISYPFSNSDFRCNPSKNVCLDTSKFILINFLQFLYKNLGKKGAL
jgi:hypothetical protein